MGPSINEGTYNGLVPFTIAARIQFTGTITHGMSGGPAITADGQVVGVNVETFENGAGLLVPVDRVAALLARTSAPGYQPPKDLLADVGAQLVALQDRSLSALLADSTPMLALGPFSVPSEPASYLKCWGDATRHSDERRYDFAKHICSTDARIKLSGDQFTGYVYLNYYHYSSDDLNPTNFYSLVQTRFSSLDGELDGDELEVTNFACRTRNVRTAPKDGTALTMRVATCLRRYRHLPGLYDAVTHVAVLGRPKNALLAVLILSGVTNETAQRLTARFVEHIR